MNKKIVPVTMEAIEELFDRKLEEKLEQKLEEKLEQKLEEKLQPIKDVIENRVYKEMKEGFSQVNKRIDILENQLAAVIEDHEPRIKRLEDIAGTSN